MKVIEIIILGFVCVCIPIIVFEGPRPLINVSPCLNDDKLSNEAAISLARK